MTITRALWLPEVLLNAGVKVTAVQGWQSRGHGDFTDLRAVVWHHDASAKGDSPGVPAFMLRNWNKAGAQLWVDRYGHWTVLASGIAYHAGKVQPGAPANSTSLGIETDHTVGEEWTAEQLRSLRVGTAAILRHLGVSATQGLHFHKSICFPKGRKVDPDGLDLDTERGLVATLTANAASRPPKPAVKPDPTPKGDDVDGFILVINDTRKQAWLLNLRTWTKQAVLAETGELDLLWKAMPNSRVRGKFTDAALRRFTEVKVT